MSSFNGGSEGFCYAQVVLPTSGSSTISATKQKCSSSGTPNPIFHATLYDNRYFFYTVRRSDSNERFGMVDINSGTEQWCLSGSSGKFFQNAMYSRASGAYVGVASCGWDEGNIEELHISFSKIEIA